MKWYTKTCIGLGLSLILFVAPSTYAMSGEELILIAPQKTSGKPLMEALNLRKSNRKIRNDETLSEQDMSNILWAAWGINRDDGRRTVPTARNKQNVTVYVVLETGIWEYNAQKHRLILKKAGDFTSKFGSPTTLLYAAPEENQDVGGVHVGSMYQNVGLYCASEGLANVVKTSVRNALDDVFVLPDGYKSFVVQLIGIPE